MVTPLLTEDDRRAVAAAIAEAERGTSGEIYCLLARDSADYREVPVAVAGAVALVLPLTAVALGWIPGWPNGWTAQASRPDVALAVSVFAAVQALLFAAAALLANLPAVRPWLAPEALKRLRVRRAATELFLSRGLQATAARTGVLIYASVAERRVEVIADETIHALVDPSAWAAPCAALTTHLAKGETAAGFIEAVQLCGAILAQHAPPTGAENVNELPDRVAEI